jgi:hypothetical protein
MVSLVDDEQLEEAGWDLVEASGEGLDAGDLHAMGEVLAVTGGDDAVAAANRVEGAADLIDELLAMHEDAYPVAADGGLLGDVDERVGLAASGGEDEQDAAMAGHEGGTDLSDSRGLEGPKCDSHAVA